MTSDLPENELPRGLALAWGVASSPQRGPKREMSVEKIVDAAIEIADADGLGAVSMAAVAARLGYTPMSLYRYVSAKDDLILLMQEEAIGLPSEAIRETGSWRAALETLYREHVQMFVAHSWVLDIPINGSPATPRSAAWMDAGLGALADTPLTHAERLAVILLVTGHARWTGIVLAGYLRLAGEQGFDDAEISRREDAQFRALISADAYPDLRAAIDAGVFVSEGDPFAFGLARALDGIEAYMAGEHSEAPETVAPWSAMDDTDIAEDKRYREAAKARRQAEKVLRDARKAERQAAREARERLARSR